MKNGRESSALLRTSSSTSILGKRVPGLPLEETDENDKVLEILASVRGLDFEVLDTLFLR